VTGFSFLGFLGVGLELEVESGARGYLVELLTSVPLPEDSVWAGGARGGSSASSFSDNFSDLSLRILGMKDDMLNEESMVYESCDVAEMVRREIGVRHREHFVPRRKQRTARTRRCGAMR
jgi:hypothetical protein